MNHDAFLMELEVESSITDHFTDSVQDLENYKAVQLFPM